MATVFSIVRAMVLATALALTVGGARAESLQGTNIDARLLLGYEVAPDAVQTFLPEGWSPVEFPRGPMTGANLLVGFLDRALQLDAEGKPADAASGLHVVLVALAKGDAGVRIYVLRTYSTDDGPGAYGNSVAADISRHSSIETQGDGGEQRRHVWKIAPAGGGVVELQARFATGRRIWSPGELTPYSNVTPDFHRIYRYDQLVDVAMSEAMNKRLAGEVKLTASVPELAELFDGSERLVAVLDVPVYVRRVYLP